MDRQSSTAGGHASCSGCGTMTMLAGAVLATLFALCCSPLLLLGMQRATIRERYRASSAHCMNCGTNFSKQQRLALVAMVRGVAKCKTCSKPVSADTPRFEIALIVLLAGAGALASRNGVPFELLPYLLFTGALFAITIIDLRHFTIPNRLLYPAFFACAGLLSVWSLLHDPDHLKTALIGMAGSWLFFFIVYLINPRGLGFGDVRLSAFIGFMAGYIHWENAFLAVILGLFIGAIAGVILMIFRRKGRKDAIPYGPFLALGAVLAIYGPMV